ncbi:MAG: hypothetical protein HRT61_16925, partial [Ekhidna sp.]|nr:hypothetical protein [Ekhidna sp.]
MKLSVFLFFSFLISISCSVETSDSRSVDIEAETIAKAEKVVESIKLLVIPDRRWNLTELAGKMPDVEGTYDFRQDIQLAIDSLAALGGGVLYFSHPDRKDFVKQILTYRIKGPIHLRSNIQLSFDTNLKLFFEFDPTAYMLPGGTLRRFEGTTIFSFSPLFYAFNEKNIALVFEDGHGVPARIDGDGMKWQAWENEVNKRRKEQGLPRSKNYVRKVNNQDVPLKDRRFTDIAMDAFRPDMISFFMCENILVDGLQLENSPFWVVHPIFSKNLTFRNISFDAPVYNNDGFDPESSKNILIENV